MGRFYYGDICGKFWFACQSSDDAVNLGGNTDLLYRFRICDCEYNFKEKHGDTLDLFNKDYCTSCFSSYEEHLAAVLDEKKSYEAEYGADADAYRYTNLNNVWYLKEDEIVFHFDEKEHLSTVENSILVMEYQVGKYIGEFRFLEDSCRFEYNLEFSPLFRKKFDSIPQNKNEQTIEDKANLAFKNRTEQLIARYCLAKQIFHCLSEHGSCTFYAET